MDIPQIIKSVGLCGLSSSFLYCSEAAIARLPLGKDLENRPLRHRAASPPEVLHSAQRVEPSAQCGITAREQDCPHPRTWDRASSREEDEVGEELVAERHGCGGKDEEKMRRWRELQTSRGPPHPWGALHPGALEPRCLGGDDEDNEGGEGKRFVLFPTATTF